MPILINVVLLYYKISRSGAVVARWAHNPKVVRSSRTSATSKECLQAFLSLLKSIEMFYVYVLYSVDYQRIYIGFTSNIESRLFAHNHPSNKGWTKNFQPWNILYTEQYENKSDAMKREKQLKSAKGREFIKNLTLKV